MRNLKRFFALVLAVCLCLCAASIFASAEGADPVVKEPGMENVEAGHEYSGGIMPLDLGAEYCYCENPSYYRYYKYYDQNEHAYGYICSKCGWPSSTYDVVFEPHSYSVSWVSSCKWARTCTGCGTTVAEGISHSYSYGDWTYSNETDHARTYTCNYGDSGVYTQTAKHSLTASYAAYDGEQHTVSQYCSVCKTAVSTATEAHADGNDDGACDACGEVMTRFSVTVPAVMPMAVGRDGTVYAADTSIVNNSTAAVAVTAITVSADSGWTLVPYAYNIAAAKVDAKLLGLCINGAVTVAGGTTEDLNLVGDWVIPKGGSLPLACDAVVSAMSAPITDEQVMTLVFVIDWA